MKKGKRRIRKNRSKQKQRKLNQDLKTNWQIWIVLKCGLLEYHHLCTFCSTHRSVIFITLSTVISSVSAYVELCPFFSLLDLWITFRNDVTANNDFLPVSLLKFLFEPFALCDLMVSTMALRPATTGLIPTFVKFSDHPGILKDIETRKLSKRKLFILEISR